MRLLCVCVMALTSTPVRASLMGYNMLRQPLGRAATCIDVRCAPERKKKKEMTERQEWALTR